MSDHDGRVCADYDARYDELEGHPVVSKRVVCLVDADETIRYAWAAEEWTNDPDIAAVHDAVSRLDCVGDGTRRD